MPADALDYMLSEAVVSTPELIRCNVARAVRTSLDAAPALAANAVRCPILRPGRGISLP
jgi:hypothetical protein